MTSASSPTPLLVQICCVVFAVGAWTIQSLLIKAAVLENNKFSKTAVVMMTELCKLVLALIVYLFFEKSPEDGGMGTKVQRLSQGMPKALYYAAPALIYVFYNILQFVNLNFFDPGTYRVLINIRVLMTGILFQIIFSIRLGRTKWIALVILLIGCVFGQATDGGLNISSPIGLLTMTIQAAASSLGGVYFQWLLQRLDATSVTLWQKNAYLYFWGVVLNFIIGAAADPASFSSIRNFSPKLWAVVFMGSMGGFSTSLLLRYLDAMMKEFVNGIEMFSVAIAQLWVFGIPARPTLFVSVGLVSFALYLYNTAGKGEKKEKAEAGDGDGDCIALNSKA